MIVAGEMQESMHRKMGSMMRKGFILGARFTFRGFVGDHNITEQVGCSTSPPHFRGAKRQHIGRSVLATPIAIERPDRQIVRQHDRKLANGR